jgi:hypothetical protein
MEMDSLLDPVIDSSHRSYFAAVEHRALEVLRPRPPGEAISIHHDWCDRYVMKYYCLSLMYSSVFLCFDNFVYCRLREAGLLTLSRLVEVGPIQLDRSLLTALVDRWRPETHTFHLPCGEMTPTLQDVAYLLGLPIVGEAVGPRVVAASWKDDLEARFALVDRVEEAGPINPHPRAAGPSKTWFLQFTVRIHSIYKFNCYNSHVPLTVETINLNCLCSLPCWLRMPTSTV